MADINVERRERSIWPWILGLILLALLIWLLASMFDREEEVVVGEQTEQTQQPTGAPATNP